jgi:hypothetical protein
MKAKAAALLVANLGVTKSHSRSYTSNDNPFWERSTSVWRSLLLSQPPSAMSALA